MGEEKVNLQDLAQKVDELLNVLNVIAKDLSDVSKSLKSATGTKSTPTPQTSPTTGAPSLGEKKDINEVKQAFSPELAGMLLFEQSGKYIIVKPRRFLGSDNFAKIASVVREIGGEYVSAGRNSHFKVAKK
ncbi:MAG: hypothetical protein NUK63_04110 [Candidatus Bathyarchaeum tardum]|nr:MAG: hypothetical protein NUK63_04110 [Candidatus Bathyarchaeum tardum]